MVAGPERIVRVAVVPLGAVVVSLIAAVGVLSGGVGQQPPSGTAHIPVHFRAAPAGLEPFAGTWFGHARTMTIAADGQASYAGRVFTWCSAAIHPPCDDGSPALGGLSEELQFTLVEGATARAMIASGTDDLARGTRLPVGSQISVTLKADDKLAVSDGWELCGPRTPADDPACSSA